MGVVEQTNDKLTGLPGKDQLEETMREAMDGESRPVSFALYDIDLFMSVNESYGHEVGDTVIRSIAEHVARELEPIGGQLFRIGGDEIAIVMPGTEKEQAFLRLEGARAGISSIAELAKLDPVPTISIGISTYPDDGSTRQEVARKADDALYRAKVNGKNRVALAREEKKVPKTSHFTQGQLDRLSTLSAKEGVGEAELLREALDDLLKKYAS